MASFELPQNTEINSV